MLLFPGVRSARADLESTLDLGLRYQHSGAPALGHSGLFETSWMVFPGGRHALCSGVDGEVGDTDGNFEYRADLLPIGYRFRGALGTVALCAGGGVRGVHQVLDAAYRARTVVDAAFDLDVVRAGVLIKAGLNVAGARRPATRVDELGVSLRLSARELTSVNPVTATSGLFVGLGYERYLRANTWALTLGYGYAARNF